MVRRRRYPAPRKALKTVKYENCTNTLTVTGYTIKTNGGQNDGVVAVNYFAIVPSSQFQGIRKCKNFTLTITHGYEIEQQDLYRNKDFVWAMIYVPESQDPGTFSPGSGSLYEPNQNVIMSGSFNMTDLTQHRYRTRLARNLNSGDYIALIMAAPYENNAVVNDPLYNFRFILNYAMCYN